MKTILLATTAMFVFGASAYAADKEKYEATTKITRDAKGNYDEMNKISKTELDGTTHISERKLVVDVDSKGNVNKKATTQITSDPKGMGNKHIVLVKDTETTKNGEVTVTHGKTVEGTKDNYKKETKTKMDSKGNFSEKDITTKTDADGTFMSFETNSKVDVDADGSMDKKTTTKEVNDPVGLGNKHTVETTNSETDKDGAVEAKQEKKVDGKTTDSATTTLPKTH